MDLVFKHLHFLVLFNERNHRSEEEMYNLGKSIVTSQKVKKCLITGRDIINMHEIQTAGISIDHIKDKLSSKNDSNFSAFVHIELKK